MYPVQQIDERTASERENLILQHLPQVHIIARRIHERVPGSVSLDDLISTGVIGLIAAIDNFDPSHNVQLRTYAEHKIRGAILDSLRQLDWAPRDVRKRAKQVEAAIFAAEQRLGRQPADEEIAAELNIALEEYQKWLADSQGMYLENPLASHDGAETVDLLQFVSDSEDKRPAALFERAELEKLVAQTIARMPKTERTVLSLYYLEELSLREIGEVTNLHLSRVSQLKAQAVLRLRAAIDKRWSLQSKGKP